MTLFFSGKGGLALFAIFSCALLHAENRRTLDDFEDLAPWSVQHTDDVSADIASAPGKTGKALRLTFDFDHVNGYATAHRSLPIDLPANYRFAFRVRGETPPNTLEIKFIDPSGENVWWVRRVAWEFPRDWTEVMADKRNIEFAWGRRRIMC